VDQIIGHIDMDAFFASVEERDKPYLKGLPVIIGSDPQEGAGRGVVSTANYTARKLGIHSALPIVKAWRFCEESRKAGGLRCAFVSPNMSRYNEASQQIFDIVRTYVPIISQTSVDEAYLDLSFCKTYKEAESLAREITNRIKKEVHLTASVGIAPTKMVAKIASDYQKPNGLTVVTPKKVLKFLEPLPIRAIPGIGKKAEQTCMRVGITTIRDAQKFSWDELQEYFGSMGFTLWERARGIDSRSVVAEAPKRKSIGKHYTFTHDTNDMHEVLEVLRGQIQTILKEVKKKGFKEFRTIVLTVRFDDFVTRTRSLTLDTAIYTKRDLELKATKLVLPFFEKVENPQGKAIRLIGVRVEKLL